MITISPTNPDAVVSEDAVVGVLALVLVVPRVDGTVGKLGTGVLAGSGIVGLAVELRE